MHKLFSNKKKSGRSKKDRPLLKSSAKTKRGKNLAINLSTRRRLAFIFRSYKNQAKKVDHTKFSISVYVFSKHREVVITYKKAPYKGIRYTNSLNPFQLLSIVITAVGLSAFIYFVFDIKNPEEFRPNRTVVLPAKSISSSNQLQKVQGLSASKPKQISISRVGIDYGVIELGQNPDETMETPPLFDKVTGWYKYSPTPGEVGPSIIVGHIDTYKGPSVFWRLREVVPGDEISITREDSSVVKFKVTGLKQFEQSNFPTEEVYGNTDEAELRLITCGGTFNKKTLHYSENTVVFATMIK